MNPFPTVAGNVFHYAFNEIVLTYLWSNKIKKKDTLEKQFSGAEMF